MDLYRTLHPTTTAPTIEHTIQGQIDYLDEMDKFLETQNLQSLNHEEILKSYTSIFLINIDVKIFNKIPSNSRLKGFYTKTK